MKFKSKKDTLFSLIIFGTIALFIGISISEISFHEMETGDFILLTTFSCVTAFLLWIYLGTWYSLSKEEGLKYRSGPLYGKINIHRITHIQKGKSLWIGYRPATARNGLIIRYDAYNEIYISPESNDAFIDYLLTLNPEISVSE